MAPFGKIHSYPSNFRALRALIIADLNGLEIEIPPFTMSETNRTPEFLAKFPLGKIPAFEGADGFLLTESIAIATYIAKSGPKAGQLLGADAQSQAKITQWTVFTETELFSTGFVPLAMTILGVIPLDVKRFNDSMASFDRNLKFIEVSLKGRKKHLVGDTMTLADLMITSFFYYGFKYMVGAEERKALPNLTAYVQHYAALPEFKKHYGELELCKNRVTTETQKEEN
ncbi:glutathione S-transferase [Nemania sp. NC0429]|nr:glutathione S-transferase [Nemania sp. NC0429]